jgi:thiol-disulfide isomerase/thioredoxin
MLSKIIEVSKPVLGIAVIITVLQGTGLLGSAIPIAQSASTKTGVLDAKAIYPAEPEEEFDYHFAIKDLQGNKVSFDQFRGKVIFLNLWATWCGPCRMEMPTIQKLYDQVEKDNIVFVMLSLDEDKDKDKIVRYVQKKSYSFPVYQPFGRLPQQLSVPSIPTTFVISKEGKIVAEEIGTTNFNTKKFRNFLETEARRASRE